MLTTTHDHGAVRVLRFNRPETLNAFNGAMFDAVTERLLAAAENDSVKVLITTGEGRAFSAGMDFAGQVCTFTAALTPFTGGGECEPRSEPH